VDRRRAGAAGRNLIVALLVALFALHQDVWFWRDARVVLGVPVGLAYHVAFSVAVTVVLALAVRWGWPREVPVGGGSGAGDERSGGEGRA
jgi:hypothetical protein